jgi:hypothetical protein
MIDTFSLAITHGLMFIIAVRLLFRPDLDKEAAPKPEEKAKGWKKGLPRNA